jgi:hypothetical protein
MSPRESWPKLPGKIEVQLAQDIPSKFVSGRDSRLRCTHAPVGTLQPGDNILGTIHRFY